jgi:hypothetical protein
MYIGSALWTPRPKPSYFAMLSGSQPFPLHIWPFSHALSNGPSEVVRKVSRSAPSRLVPLNDYSVFFGRGDLFHAGASGSETNTVRGEHVNVRLHTYLARSGATLQDEVHLPANCEFAFHDTG